MPGPLRTSLAVGHRHLPARAVMICFTALAVPIVAAAVTRGGAGPSGLLIWLPLVVPALLLTYYRGRPGAVLALTTGVVVLAVTHVALPVLGNTSPDWPVVMVVLVNFLVVTAGLAVFAERLQRDRHMVEQLALIDSLTELPNRRQAELILEREFAAAIRGRELGVVAYDVDHFKQFNDRFGHAAGDEVLRTFADVLRQCTRQQDLSARYGGEEFLSVASDIGLDGLISFANRVRTAVDAVDTQWGKITVSAGIAMYRDGMGSFQVLVAAADRALYAAKENGRNRVEVLEEIPARRLRVSQSVVSAERRWRILVVADDRETRAEVTDLLTRAGYDTEQTVSPHDAVKRLQDGRDRPVDLLVTNVMMPRISGFTLVDQLSAVAPDLRVVYLSANMRERVSWSGVPGAVTRFVAKPVEPQTLLDAVRDALEQEVEPTSP